MKGKNVFFALGLALTMGLGVGAAFSGAKAIKPAEAAVATEIYFNFDGCQKLKDKYSEAGASAKATAYFIGGSNPDTTWPGTDMNKVSNHVYSIATKANTEGVIFTVNGWGNECQTIDIDFDNTGLDMYVISTNNASAKQSGSWKKYYAYSIIGKFGSYNWDTDVGMAYSAGYATYGPLALTTTSELKLRTNCSWETSYGYDELTAESKGLFNRGTGDSNNNMIPKVAGSYNFTLDANAGTIEASLDTTKYDVHVMIDGVERGGAAEKINEGALPAYPDNLTYGTSFTGWFDNAECTEGHEVTAITSNTTVYGKTFATPTKSYYINLGYHTEAGIGHFSDLNMRLWAWQEDECGTRNNSSEAFPGDVGILSRTIEVPEDAQFIIAAAGTDPLQQTVNVTQSGVNNDWLNILPSKDGEEHWNTCWNDEAPHESGYYVSGIDGWTYRTATKMDSIYPADAKNRVAKIENFTAHVDDEIRIRSFYIDRTPYDQWSTYTGEVVPFGGISGDNFKFTQDGTYNIYAKYVDDQFKFEIEKVYTFACKVLINGANPVDLAPAAKGDYDAQYTADITVAAGDVLSFTVDSTPTVVAEDNTNEHNVFVPTHKVIKGGTVPVYLKYSGGSWSYWLGGRGGTRFFVYSNNELVPMVANPGNVNEVMATGISLVAGKTVQFYEKEAAVNPTSFDIDPEIAGAIVMPSTTVNVVTSGAYNLYYNFTTGALYVDDLTPADVAANDFIDTFLFELSDKPGHICNGDDTVYEDLKTAWGTLQTAFNNIASDPTVKADAQNILKTVTSAEAGKRGEFARLYDFIMTKYKNRTDIPDFAQRTSGSSGVNGITILGGSNNTVVLVTMISVIVVMTSVALFFYNKKRREN